MNQEPQDIYDIRPIIPLEDSSLLWLWLVITLVIVITLIIFLWWRWRHHKQTSTILTKEIDPYHWFIAAMEGLTTKNLSRVEHCYQLSFLFREYIERRYRFPATDRTSEEVLQQLQRAYYFSDAEMTTIRRLFAVIDPVKYASNQPSSHDMEWVEKSMHEIAEGHRPIGERQ